VLLASASATTKSLQMTARAAVAALKVEIHTVPKAVLANQNLDHLNHFAAPVIDGGGAKVVDFDVEV
jgi:chromosome condensin MukBEF complex kleisin-like MukF subunit